MVDFILLSLACFSISYILVNKDGPFDTIKKLRRFFGISEEVIQNELGIEEIVRGADTMLGKLFLCPICLSGWFCFLFSICYFLSPSFVYIVYPFSLWGVVIVLVERT